MSVTPTATEPIESHGLDRDQVRMLVATPHRFADVVFRDLPHHLTPGDLVVVNRSATVPAALDGRRADGTPVEIHVANALDDGTYVVEIRPAGRSFGPVPDVGAGERFELAAGATLDTVGTLPGQARLHRAVARIEGPLEDFLAAHGRAISYGYVPRRWPLSAYQTIFGIEPGSAEMPSAGRPFTHRTVTDLVTRGVLVAPITLHTTVSSPEADEPPNPERYAVPPETAALVNHVRRHGHRVVAVGTTVTRALETVAAPDGTLSPGRGWTDLVLSVDRPARAVTGLITGWHEPGASHVRLLESVAGHQLVARAYVHAAAAGYLRHEFGDSCLLLP